LAVVRAKQHGKSDAGGDESPLVQGLAQAGSRMNETPLLRAFDVREGFRDHAEPFPVPVVTLCIGVQWGSTWLGDRRPNGDHPQVI
jgi:hypothetical protein